jgi:hypothetical protein
MCICVLIYMSSYICVSTYYSASLHQFQQVQYAYVSSYVHMSSYVCPHIYICPPIYVCPHTPSRRCINLSRYNVHMCPHTFALIYTYVPTRYASAYEYECVCMLLLDMCPHTTTYTTTYSACTVGGLKLLV